jgi:anti-sigma regulatory factor (Ser/Thr protein kinase)
LTALPYPQILGGELTDKVHWLELPALRARVGEARHAVGGRLRAWGLTTAVCEDAVLILSELVTNAIRHTPSTRILCCVGLGRGRLVHLEVHDEDMTPRNLPACHPTLDDESGRGLLLVESIADQWGVEPSTFTAGHAVWAALAPKPERAGA